MRCSIVGTATSMSALWSAISRSVASGLNRRAVTMWFPNAPPTRYVRQTSAVEDRGDDHHCSLTREGDPVDELCCRQWRHLRSGRTVGQPGRATGEDDGARPVCSVQAAVQKNSPR